MKIGDSAVLSGTVSKSRSLVFEAFYNIISAGYAVSAEKTEREERTGKSQFALLSATFGQFTKTA